MNQDNDSSRQNALTDLIAAQRISQNASDQMDEAFGALLGISRTEGRALDIIHRRGRVTAGDLGREAGLTSGAVTALVDRLEGRGYLARERDAQDRRKVWILPTERSNDLAEKIYGAMGRVGQRYMAGMPVIQMQLLTRYLSTGAWMNLRLAEALRAVTGSGPASPEDHAEAFARMIERDLPKLEAGLLETWRNGAPRAGGTAAPGGG